MSFDFVAPFRFAWRFATDWPTLRDYTLYSLLAFVVVGLTVGAVFGGWIAGVVGGLGSNWDMSMWAGMGLVAVLLGIPTVLLAVYVFNWLAIAVFLHAGKFRAGPSGSFRDSIGSARPWVWKYVLLAFLIGVVSMLATLPFSILESAVPFPFNLLVMLPRMLLSLVLGLLLVFVPYEFLLAKRGFGDSFREGVSLVFKHPWESIVSYVLLVVASLLSVGVLFLLALISFPFIILTMGLLLVVLLPVGFLLFSFMMLFSTAYWVDVFRTLSPEHGKAHAAHTGSSHARSPARKA